ncbi:Uncharacterised protein [Legionella beliardensis]|uniref:Uncharacterized protein n=1 Tax=Legionella beliardensis TaxID=91822 RepID=A0A378I273_9GAMM|nr:hypothetical protein [Legionella beliardensis]STX28830.1 Uncharacterised protein [Legionella beliardensis]
MSFTIPGFKELLNTSKKLVSSYQVTRDQFDSQRIFASIRPKTHNPERLNDAACIEKLATYIMDNKFNYQNLDLRFNKADYAKVIAPFLKEALSGALLLELIKITNTYSKEEDAKNSALAKIILDVFKINKLSDVPTEQLNKCLTNFLYFIEVYEQAAANKNLNIPLHQTKSNEDLKQEISSELRKLTNNLACAI